MGFGFVGGCHAELVLKYNRYLAVVTLSLPKRGNCAAGS